MKKLKQFELWKAESLRALAVLGFTFFSLALQSGVCYNNFEAGFIAGGLYLFTALIRAYRIDLNPRRIKKKNTYLIFP